MFFFSQRMENFRGDSTVQWSSDDKVLTNEVYSNYKVFRGVYGWLRALIVLKRGDYIL